MRKILIKLKVIQEKPVYSENGYRITNTRLNPYNPLSYVSIITTLIIAPIAVICALINLGVENIVGNKDLRNPFKWK